VNFYKRFIGDITAKTGGLSMSRMGAYDRLLDHFYSTELPIAPEEVYSICRAMNKADREDVDAVLVRFWTLTSEGYVQAKAEEVIAKARPLIEAARANGKKGGRPKKQNPDETQPVYKENPEETQGEPSAKAIQSQSQISPSLRSGDKPQDVSDDVWRDFLTTRKAKLTQTALKGIRKQADTAGLTLEQALETACERGWKSFKAEWLHNVSPAAPPRVANLSDRRAQTIAGLTNPGPNHGHPNGTLDVETRIVG
jgi:uncharacterized protein YdaU (DUF1376 family)